jgi:DedD protein
MATTQDTEITLGTGKLLAIFFGLVALCAVFFGLGFSFGRNPTKSVADSAPASSSTVRADGTKPAPSSKSAPMRTADLKDSDSRSTASPVTGDEVAARPANLSTASTDSSNAYFVQVAAVTRQEDAQALVDALKQKQYPAFSTNSPADKLLHVQVGPFTDVKDAEAQRAKLVGDGYNPILKK